MKKNLSKPKQRTKVKSPKDGSCPVPAGILVIIGGKEDKGEGDAPDRENPSGFVTRDVLGIFTALIKKKNSPVLVVTSGSSKGDETFADYKKVFKELDYDLTVQMHHDNRQAALNDSLSEKLEKAGAVFFCGGDQLLLSSLYGGTPFLTRLKERYISDEIVIGGTSAGAMVLSTPMIYAGSQEVQQVSGEIKVTTGLAFMKDVCIDTHFVHRSRFIRLAQVIATNPGCIGMGIEEDTAVVIRNGLEGVVAGSGTVIIIDGFQITDSDMKSFTEKKPFSVRNLKVDILASGDSFVIDEKNPPHR